MSIFVRVNKAPQILQALQLVVVHYDRRYAFPYEGRYHLDPVVAQVYLLQVLHAVQPEDLVHALYRAVPHDQRVDLQIIQIRHVRAPAVAQVDDAQPSQQPFLEQSQFGHEAQALRL